MSIIYRWLLGAGVSILAALAIGYLVQELATERAEKAVLNDKLQQAAEQIKQERTDRAKFENREVEIAKILRQSRSHADTVSGWLRDQRGNPLSAAAAAIAADPSNSGVQGRAGEADGAARDREIDEACAATSAEFRAVKDALLQAKPAESSDPE